jgi:hypothetical protein
MKTGVWEYIDPSSKDPTTLLPPIRPIPDFVRTAAQGGTGVVPQTTTRVSTRASSSQTAQPTTEDPLPRVPISYGSLTVGIGGRDGVRLECLCPAVSTTIVLADEGLAFC